MKNTQKVILQIEDLTREGDGVGHLNGDGCPEEWKGIACFVPGALPGEEVEASVYLKKKNFAKADLLRILQKSPDRVEPACPYGECGGCGLSHLKYDAQLRIKEKWVRDALHRIGGCENLEIRPIIGSDEPFRYRNKAELAIGDHGEVGFMAAKSHKVVDCKSCLLMPREVEEAAEEIRAYLAEGGDPGAHRALVRVACGTNDMMVALEQKEKDSRGRNQEKYAIWTEDHTLMEYACGLKWEISPDSFFQVNTAQMEKLYGVVKKFADMSLEAAGTKKKPVILDLYCGIGTIGLTLASEADHVLGIEAVKPAVLNANRNAAVNGIVNAEFLCGRAEEVLPEMLAAESDDAGTADVMVTGTDMIKTVDCRAKLKFPSGFTAPADVVIMDPPRAGCDVKLLDAAVLTNPERMIYVSCDPATLARDIKYLSAKGYAPIVAQPVDMFPQTGHVETVVLITRKEK